MTKLATLSFRFFAAVMPEGVSARLGMKADAAAAADVPGLEIGHSLTLTEDAVNAQLRRHSDNVYDVLKEFGSDKVVYGVLEQALGDIRIHQYLLSSDKQLRWQSTFVAASTGNRIHRFLVEQAEAKREAMEAAQKAEAERKAKEAAQTKAKKDAEAVAHSHFQLSAVAYSVSDKFGDAWLQHIGAPRAFTKGHYTVSEASLRIKIGLGQDSTFVELPWRAEFEITKLSKLVAIGKLSKDATVQGRVLPLKYDTTFTVTHDQAGRATAKAGEAQR